MIHNLFCLMIRMKGIWCQKFLFEFVLMHHHAGFDVAVSVYDVEQIPSVYHPSGDVKVLAIDCGMKASQIRCMVTRGACVKVVPWDHPILSEGVGTPLPE